MDNNTPILNQTAALVKKDFALEEAPDFLTEDDLLAFLEDFVQQLIDGKLEKLFYALYRLDIDERKVRKALHPTASQPPHQVIAKLILEREKQKAQTRIKYAQKDVNKGDGWNE